MIVFSIGLRNSKCVNYNFALNKIITGLFKKILIADKITVLADYYFEGILNGYSLSTLGLWIGLIAYSLQLYYDFSGYSDIAIGIGNLLGFNIPENFCNPYLAKSISDFWKRWHISLSQWFRDYVYIPLGGNRCSALRHIFNLLVVWLLTGIWHGANLTFIIWGLGYCVLLIIEKYVPIMKKIEESFLGHVYTLLFVNILWIPFRSDNLQVAKNYFIRMFDIRTIPLQNTYIESIAIQYMPYVIVAIILCLPFERILQKYQSNKVFIFIKETIVIALAFLTICALTNSSYSPYIYGAF